MTAIAGAAVSVDAFLGGRVEAVQPDNGGHRSGLEAVLLASAIEGGFDGVVVDLGAGAGVAGMCVAARCPSAQVVLVDHDETALAAARAALRRPANRQFAERVSIVAADIAAPEAERVAAGLGRAFADAVILNPPFRTKAVGTVSPSAFRAAAHVFDGAGIETWFRTAASVLKPDGLVVAIFTADGIGELLNALDGRFGEAVVLPIHPRPGAPAHRIVVRAMKGSRARPLLLPGLTLHPATGGTYLPEAEAILRHGAGLGKVHTAWGEG